jgi:hypothetical protein
MAPELPDKIDTEPDSPAVDVPDASVASPEAPTVLRVANANTSSAETRTAPPFPPLLEPEKIPTLPPTFPPAPALILTSPAVPPTDEPDESATEPLPDLELVPDATVTPPLDEEADAEVKTTSPLSTAPPLRTDTEREVP